MIKYILAFMIITSVTSHKAAAQPKEEKEVSAAVENFRLAMADGDTGKLDKLTADSITYGHSSGFIQHKPEFLKSFADGSTDFVSLNFLDQTIQLFGNTAIVRHILDADTNDNNKPGHVKLKILLVWQKQKGMWKLLARQAVKFNN
ncbi:nuclear transport factor 2 family protein [Parafilimonas sp.]|uniref:nuclear transport factor 2 family protein n=1 Tax=Parafilimonas sp. TaxID=1969739 RepID=UPI0039E3E738